MSSPILRDRLMNLLMTGPVLRIDFTLDPFRVEANGFNQVWAALAMDGMGFKTIDAVVGTLVAGAGAEYKTDLNSFVFPNEQFGLTPEEQGEMVHESVHALLDIKGFYMAWGRMPPWPTFIGDEAAAYVAYALYMRYAYPGRATGSHPIYDIAFRIADAIKNRPGAIVPEADASSLSTAIANNKTYKDLGVDLWTPDTIDGI